MVRWRFETRTTDKRFLKLNRGCSKKLGSSLVVVSFNFTLSLVTVMSSNGHWLASSRDRFVFRSRRGETQSGPREGRVSRCRVQTEEGEDREVGDYWEGSLWTSQDPRNRIRTFSFSVLDLFFSFDVFADDSIVWSWTENDDGGAGRVEASSTTLVPSKDQTW